MTAVDRHLLKRLPRSFAPALNEQLDKWEFLFPCEQRLIRDQMGYLAGLPAGELEDLFRPVKQVETRMRLPAWDAASAKITVSQTSELVRSPLYPKWRQEVETVFARINEALERLRNSAPPNKVVVCTLPAGLPLPPGPVWPELARRGRAVSLGAPFRAVQGEVLLALARSAPAETEPVERTWVLECGRGPADARGGGPEGLTLISFEALAAVRREFLGRLNLIRKDLRSLDKTYAALSEMDLAPLLGPELKADRRIGAFVRDLFLSGNGAVLFGNSFVQWGACEIMRRAQPQALFCAFGIRRKLKPYSSVVLFEDQGRANPVPDEDDPAASLADARVLAEYVVLAADRLPAYQERTLCVLAAADLPEALLICPRPLEREVKSAGDLIGLLPEWLAEGRAADKKGPSGRERFVV